MSKKQGKGTTVTFVSASGNISGVCITDVQDGGQTVAMEDAVCMDSTEMEKIGNELIDLGDVTVSLLHDPEVNVRQLLSEKGVLTITSPVSNAGAPESETGNAVMSSYSKGRPVGTLMTSSITFSWNGDGTYTYTAEAGA